MSSNQREINYQFLTSSKNFLYDAREDGKTHTPFHYELLLFRAIQNRCIGHLPEQKIHLTCIPAIELREGLEEQSAL